MHDPMTVAFEIRQPWGGKTYPMKDGSTWHYRPALITIWHVDPERDGSDDSCGWFRPPLTKKELAWAKEIITNPDDNIAHWFTGRDDDEKIWQLCLTLRNFRRTQRPWWRHPRWHFWHWRFQIHSILRLKRWLFSRCAACGQRFPWGYAPISTWNSTGPLWFRSEHAWHAECDPSSKQ